jgi:hypothetical protein
MTEEPMTMTWPSDELGRRLAAYAFALTPRTDTSARIRASVMASAAETLRPAGAWRPTAVVEPGPTQVVVERPGFNWLRRRVAVGVFAAGMGVAGVTGVVAASAPGGALYETRLWAESLTLPTEMNARLDADVIRLDARLAEARRAAQGGNAGGVSAALDAYVDVLDDALSTAGLDAGRDERIATALSRHRDVLTALEIRLPGQAAAALDRALARTDAAIGGLEHDGSNDRDGNAGGSPGGNSTGPGNGAPGATQGGGGGTGHGPSSSHRTDTPDETRSPAPKSTAGGTASTVPAAPTASASAGPESRVHRQQADVTESRTDDGSGSGSPVVRRSVHRPSP